MGLSVQMPKMEEWQMEVINGYIQHPKNQWFVTKSVRQVGKSICLQYLLVAASLSEENSESIAISPIMSQSRKLFTDILKWAGKLIVKSNATILELKFINGSIITFGSAEQGDSLRGKTVRRRGILVVDEAAYVNEDFFYEILVPMTNVYQNDIFLFSTPKFKSGLFYNLFMKGMSEDNDNVISYDWTEYNTSKFLSSETLELYRQQLPKLAFRSEFLGEFIDGDGSVFTDFKPCVGVAQLNKFDELWISVDWGTGQGKDSTVLTIGQFFMNKIQIKECIGFNDKNTNETVDYILKVVKGYVKQGFKTIHIIVEKNSIGQVFFDVLNLKVDDYEMAYNSKTDYRNEITINTSTFTTTNRSKERAIKKLMVLFENRKIVIPSSNALLTQLAVYECKINNNTVTYNAPIGMHDDYIMSLVFIVDNLFQEVE